MSLRGARFCDVAVPKIVRKIASSDNALLARVLERAKTYQGN